eukprot:gene3201-13588_t
MRDLSNLDDTGKRDPAAGGPPLGTGTRWHRADVDVTGDERGRASRSIERSCGMEQTRRGYGQKNGEQEEEKEREEESGKFRGG